MINFFYMISALGIAVVILVELADKARDLTRREKVSKESFASNIIRISASNKFFIAIQPEEGGSFYKEILNVVKSSSIPWLTVGRLNTVSVLMGFLCAGLYVLYKLSNIVTSLLNYDRVLQVAAEMQDDSIAEIVYFNSNTLVFLVVAFAVGYFSPWLFLKAVRFRNENLTRQEAVMMKTYAIMMLKTNKNVKFVIEVMYKRANMFKESLGRLWAAYSLDPAVALQTAMEETESEDFKKIINTLYKSVKYDRDSAVEYLERDREMSQQLGKIRDRERNQTKDSISTVMMMVPLIAAVVVVGYPLMTQALKYIGNSPV